MVKQLAFDYPRRGGKRKGAGRPRIHDNPGLLGPGVRHVKRAAFGSTKAVHVTHRVRPGVGYLRRQAAAQTLQQVFRQAAERFGMRIVHYSIQGSHLHLVVEADGRTSLSRGMQGLAIRYVTTNYLHHAREALPEGFRDPLATAADSPLTQARTWLLAVGWKSDPVVGNARDWMPRAGLGRSSIPAKPASWLSAPTSTFRSCPRRAGIGRRLRVRRASRLHTGRRLRSSRSRSNRTRGRSENPCTNERRGNRANSLCGMGTSEAEQLPTLRLPGSSKQRLVTAARDPYRARDRSTDGLVLISVAGFVRVHEPEGSSPDHENEDERTLAQATRG